MCSEECIMSVAEDKNVGSDLFLRHRAMQKETRKSTSPNHRGKDAVISRTDHTSTKDTLQGDFWLTRIIFLRMLALVYSVAFLVAFHQNRQLIGKRGLLPADLFMARVKSHFGGVNYDTVSAVPSLLWLFDWKSDIDHLLNELALCGLFISALIFVSGAANMLMMALLWVLYHSIVSVGQTWYSFGWESQLLETGFLAIFLVPVKSCRRFPDNCPTPWVAKWGYRWLLFRIMLGAGLIKIRGDQCWRDLTCMDYHYQTQPVPNPVSYYLHQSPWFVHRFETASNHVVELLCPILLLLPIRRLCGLGGILQLVFQVVLIISGNLSFLNWLTLLPSIFCFDDSMLSFLFSRSTLKKRQRAASSVKKTKGYYMRQAVSMSTAALIAYLSIPVVQNLLSSQQAMNTSFEPLKIVNTYGAFGSVTKERTEVVVQVAWDQHPQAANWTELEFKCKPGSVARRPCLISPYHYRLDWLMWFAAFQNYQHNPWLIHLSAKILAGDRAVEELMASNPLLWKKPKWLRMQHYRYEYTRLRSTSKNWWKRRLVGEYFPTVQLSDLQQIVQQQGWRLPED